MAHKDELVDHLTFSVETYLDQITKYDHAIHAWVAVDAAGALEGMRLGGMTLGNAAGEKHRPAMPLSGVTLGIKDIIDVAGFPMRAGSLFTSDVIITKDAPLVAKLRAAGAIIVGKTVTTEFAYLDPPATCNPWNLNRTPGGSSSGSAAAVAAGMCRAAIGTQTGGSVLRPAAFCGVVGFKPTFGWSSTEGIVPLSPSLDHVGIFARNVSDVAMIYQAVVASEFSLELQPPRIGAVGGCFEMESSTDVQQVASQAIATLKACKATVLPLELPDIFSTVHGHHLRIMAYEAARTHQERYEQHREQLGPKIRELIEQGRMISVADYNAALRHRAEFQAAMSEVFANHNCVLIMPSAPTTAPTRETTGSPRFNSPWSYAGLPAISIPCGLAADGMPVGLQLVAELNEERKLLDAAAWCERVLKFTNVPKLME